MLDLFVFPVFDLSAFYIRGWKGFHEGAGVFRFCLRWQVLFNVFGGGACLYGSGYDMRCYTLAYFFGAFCGGGWLYVGASRRALFVRKNTKFVNSRMMELFMAGCPSCGVIGVSTLACTKGLSGLSSVTSTPGCSFRGVSVASFSTMHTIFRGRRPANMVRLTTRDRISQSVASPFYFVHAGMVNAYGLLRYTGRL